MLREAHADTTAMVERHPGGAARRVEEGIEQRPVRNGVGAVLHGFRFPVGAGDGARVQMIAPDHDRALEFTRGDHLVELQADPVTIAEPHPADASRQALESNTLRSEAHTYELQALMRTT